MRQTAQQSSDLNILLLTHTWGFPNGYAATIRARLMGRALVESGAHVSVLCTRFSERLPDVVNVESSGEYEGIEFTYTTGDVTRSSSFLKRRAIDGRGLVSALRTIVRMRKAGELDAVYLWSTGGEWNPLSQIYVSFLSSLKVPIVLELNERPWSLASRRTPIERVMSPLRGATGVIAISEYLEAWARSEAQRLRRDIRILRVPILVDIDETQAAMALAPRGTPFVLFSCAPGRDHLFRFAAEAMRQVWREGWKCDLVIVGPSRDDERNRWMADLGTKGGQDSVVWLGRVPRDSLLGLCRQAQALLLPLDDTVESNARFPTKLGEYLASATPVVVSPVGEPLRFLVDDYTAYLAPVGGAAAFGRRVLDVLRQPNAAREVGRRGRELAAKEFDYRSHAQHLNSWFTALADGSRES